MLFDFHTHTSHSPDGFESMESMCAAALKKGISKLAITDHYEAMCTGVFFDTFDPARIQKECDLMNQKYKEKLEILYGVELGQPHFDLGNSRILLQNYPFDFVIGSVHNLKGDNDIYRFDYKKIDCGELYAQYVVELLEMARCDYYDVVGHLTYPLRYMFERLGRTVDLKKYEASFRALFQILREKGKGIELNTSGMRQKLGEPMPPFSLLKLYRQCGGEIVTVGSDAHRSCDLGKGILEGYEMLKEAGFRYVTVYKKRKPEFIRLK